MSKGTALRKSLKDLLHPRAIVSSTGFRVVLMIIVLYIISGILEPSYFSGEHLMTILVISCFLGIICVGQTIVILTGGADLSVAYSVTLSACIFAQTYKATGSALAGFAAAMAVGLAIGLLKGIGVSFLGITAMVMTLATNSILMSVTFLYTQGVLKGNSSPLLTVLAKDSVFGIRYVVLLWIAIGAIVVFLLKKTVFGRKIYAIGSSLRVSSLSAIDTKRTLVCVYIIATLTMSLAGVLLVGYIGYPNYTMGDGFQLISIAAVVIGGTSIMGGHGSYLGTMGGVIIIYLIQSILTILNIADAGKQIVNGLIILLVLFAYGRGKKLTA
jgi:ribose transport system permease protein